MGLKLALMVALCLRWRLERPFGRVWASNHHLQRGCMGVCMCLVLSRLWVLEAGGTQPAVHGRRCGWCSQQYRAGKSGGSGVRLYCTHSVEQN